VSRFHLHPETAVAEFALVVGDAWQRRGLGRHLLERLIAIARERGVKRLVGQVLAENGPMLELTRKLGFTAAPTEDATVIAVSLDLDGHTQGTGSRSVPCQDDSEHENHD
jgi:acetyltransferase